MTNILIGVGGTGAKTVEAALVLMAAGIGSGPVYVGLIDQDGANGNVERTRQLLDRLASFRALWSRSSHANRIDWSGPGAPGLGSIEVYPLFDRPQPNALWSPARTDNSLQELLGQNLTPDQRHLFDLLFMAGPEEQTLPLAQGYRGRAHVGAAALAAALADNDNVLINRLETLMEPPVSQPVNVFIVGSAFGGTGASGFPTLARKLHRIRSADGFRNREGTRLGGMLMLPYFSFDDPEDDSVAVVTADELMPKAQLALEYYENLFEQEQTLDRFYLLGWDPIIALNYHKAGSREQSNPALPPELVAASAVIDFFRPVDAAEPSDTGVARMVSARAGTTIKWRDLPASEHQSRLGQLLRFAAYWRYVFEPQLDRPDRLMARNWARTLAQGSDPAEFQNELGVLRGLLDHILDWAATVEHTGGAGNWANGPWTLRGLLDGAHAPSATQPVALATQIEEDPALNAFDEMIRFDSEEAVGRRGHGMYHELAGLKTAAGNHTGLGRALAAAYAAARIK